MLNLRAKRGVLGSESQGSIEVWKAVPPKELRLSRFKDVFADAAVSKIPLTVWVLSHVLKALCRNHRLSWYLASLLFHSGHAYPQGLCTGCRFCLGHWRGQLYLTCFASFLKDTSVRPTLTTQFKIALYPKLLILLTLPLPHPR